MTIEKKVDNEKERREGIAKKMFLGGCKKAFSKGELNLFGDQMIIGWEGKYERGENIRRPCYGCQIEECTGGEGPYKIEEEKYFSRKDLKEIFKPASR